MNDQASRILVSLVSRYGSSIAYDPLRCEGLLRDTCPRCTREIFVLVNAVRQQVPADLLAPRHSLPPALFRGFLVKRLQDELAFSDEAAHWAVETWASALGLDAAGMNGNASSAETPRQDPAPADVLPARTTPEQRAGWAQDLDSDDPAAGIRAVSQMGTTPDTETLRLLITALKNPAWKVREAAFDTLAGLGEPAVTPLIEALRDSHERVVTASILLLGAARSRSATEPLTALLDDRGVPLPALIWALGEIGDNRAVTPLAKFLGSSDPQVRSAAEDALKKFT